MYRYAARVTYRYGVLPVRHGSTLAGGNRMQDDGRYLPGVPESEGTGIRFGALGNVPKIEHTVTQADFSRIQVTGLILHILLPIRA